MTKTDVNKKGMVEAMEKALGVVTTACKIVGISRETHYRWIKEDEEYRNQINDIENIALDFAESKLHEQINEGSVPSIIFYLKTKGKKRGYVERQEIDTTIKQPDFSNLTTDEILDLLRDE